MIASAALAAIDHPTPLDRLAAMHGIEPTFEDAFGARRAVTPETQRALLAAMGRAATTDAEVRDSLEGRERARWGRPLDPVIVVHAGKAGGITLRTPEAETGTATWRIEAGGSTLLAGRFELDAIAPTGRATVGGETFVARSLPLAALLRPGRHEVRVEIGRTEAAVPLLITPERCFGLRDLGAERLFGLATQVYALRSKRNLGMGDFTDLGRLAEIGAGIGAATIGINPLHALYPGEPRHIGPYSPSNRMFLNVLYIDVEAVPELAHADEARRLLAAPETRAAIASARAADLVDQAEVAAIKLPVLQALHRAFRKTHHGPRAATARAKAYQRFVREGGEALERQARFDALHDHHWRHGEGTWSWRSWPEALRDPGSPEVEAFTRAHDEEVSFFRYLQFVADEQLGAAQARAKDAGMALGLYRDLAVGVHPDGAMAWSNPGITVVGATVGAPPDPFNARGQNWGLAPFSPAALRDAAYAPLADDVARNMRHAGAIRIDHAMGLSRLFWIPEGGDPSDGAYVRYPFDEMKGVIALQSREQQCVVIGEDLGTVEPGFSEGMRKAGMLSYRVLYFERDGSAFRRPEHYPPEALITPTTHDLPTLAGFWSGRDLDWRRDLDLYPDRSSQDAAENERAHDRHLLLEALKDEGLIARAIGPDALTPDMLLEAVCRWLGKAPSALVTVQIEDLLLEVEQANLPGTIDQHPNWRRKLSLDLDALADAPGLRRLGAVMAACARAGPTHGR